jgi:hypothetical protein
MRALRVRVRVYVRVLPPGASLPLPRVRALYRRPQLERARTGG